MASVFAVSSTDFRASSSQTQNALPEGDDPFADILKSLGNASVRPERPEAPRVPERRTDAPSKQSKPETDADRQAKRRAPEAERPEGKSKPEATASVSAAKPDEEDDTEASATDTAPDVEALLALTTHVQPETVASEQPSMTNASAAPAETQQAAAAVAPAQNIAAPAAAPMAQAATAPAGDAASASLQAAQNPAPAKPLLDPAKIEAEGEAAAELPKISSDNAPLLAKPLKATSALDALIRNSAQAPAQTGPVNVANATPLQGLSQLEMLHAAIQKHAQLALGNDASEPAADVQKSLISSNAVAPNFAVTTQANAPVSVQTQTAADASRAVPLEQLAVEIASRASKGERRFDIRLDPPELGRIDVRLEIDSKGNTTTKLVVERAETLDMLQRDARGLEKALQNAGLKTDAGGLQFSLQQDTQTQHGPQHHAPDLRHRPDAVQAETEVLTEIQVGNAGLAAQLRGGVDIRI